MTERIKSVRDLVVYKKAFDAAMNKRWKIEDGSNGADGMNDRETLNDRKNQEC
jgi:hypothetical protein